MEPSNKVHAIDKLLIDMFGVDRKQSVSENTCVFCGAQVTGESFRDELSLREFTISGMCQECQDKTFGIWP